MKRMVRRRFRQGLPLENAGSAGWPAFVSRSRSDSTTPLALCHPLRRFVDSYSGSAGGPESGPLSNRSSLVAKGLLMIRRAVSARSGRATAHSETGPYRRQRYRYHQISLHGIDCHRPEDGFPVLSSVARWNELGSTLRRLSLPIHVPSSGLLAGLVGFQNP